MLEHWAPTRVDYAINVLNAPIQPYMYLFHKGANPPNGKLKCSHEKLKKFKNTSYWRPYKSFTINFYDKLSQLREDDKKLFEKLEKTGKITSYIQQILRLEIQLRLLDKSYIGNLLGLDDIGNLSIKDLWDKEFAYRTIYRYIKYNVGTEDFFPKAKARELLLKAEKGELFHRATEFMNILNTSNSHFRSAEVKFNSRGEERYPRYLKDKVLPVFRKAGVNPLTLPEKWEIPVLPNPVRFLECLK